MEHEKMIKTLSDMIDATSVSEVLENISEIAMQNSRRCSRDGLIFSARAWRDEATAVMGAVNRIEDAREEQHRREG